MSDEQATEQVSRRRRSRPRTGPIIGLAAAGVLVVTAAIAVYR